MNKSMNHIKKEIMNMSGKEIIELQESNLLHSVGESSGERGEVLKLTSSDVRPPVDTSPQMVKITEKNLSVCFKTKTEPKFKTDQRKLLAEIRRDY